MGVQYTNTMRTLSLLLLAASAFAQETHVCDDGWDLYTITWEGVEHHSCFKFGGTEEKLTYSTALAACHGMGEGVFMAEVPWGPNLNHWIGEWYWEYSNRTIQWFDWGDGEPNNANGGQNCLTYMLYEDIIFPQFKDFKWNDWGCDQTAHFICEKRID